MTQTEAGRRMSKARAGVILDHPFFGSLALRLKVLEDPTCNTMWVDGVTLGYSPKYVMELPLDEVKTIICHEVMHVANGHHCRMGLRNHEKWNIACDYPINNALKKAGLPLPKNVLVDQFIDESAESIYPKLPDPPPQGGGGGNGKDQKPNPMGEVRPYPGKDGQKPSQVDLEQEENNWKVAAKQAAQVAKAAGRLPAGLERFIDELLEPKVCWKEALRQFVAQVAKNDYTFSRPNRRYLITGFILPSLFNHELPPMELGIDTSCSVTKDHLRQFAAEADDILNQYPTVLNVSYIDTKVQHEESFTMEDRPIRLNAKGGGGTRFSPFFEHVNKKDVQPCCAIYMTDLECDDFGPEPEYPVLWIYTGGRVIAPKVPFGEVIHLTD